MCILIMYTCTHLYIIIDVYLNNDNNEQLVWLDMLEIYKQIKRKDKKR